MIMMLLPLIASFILAFIFLALLIPILRKYGHVGNDVNKPDRPVVAEMGGIAVILAVVISLAIFGYMDELVYSIIPMILVIAIIGLVDDLYSIPQLPKAVIPMLAGIPLLFLLQGTVIHIPILGNVDFGVYAYFAIVFLSLAVASNLTNMLAGFNGMEWGMALPMYIGSLIIGVILNIDIVILISSVMIGACAAGFWFGFPKAKAFPGDVGTLSIGGIMAIMILVGHIEAYAVVFIPYIVDFIIKAKNKMPSTGWWGTYKEGKLHCEGSPKGFAQQVMKWANGISEIKLVMWFIFCECLFVSLGYVAVMWP